MVSNQKPIVNVKSYYWTLVYHCCRVTLEVP